MVASRRPPRLLQGPSPGPPPQRPRLARRVSCSTPRRGFNQTHWDGTEQAPGTRNTARATTREHAEPRASAPPPARALLAGTPKARRTASRAREGPSAPLPPPDLLLGGCGTNLPPLGLGQPGSGKEGREGGGKGRPPLKRQAPQVAPVGTRTNSRPRGRQGGGKGKEATGAEKRLCVRPACGAPDTCAPGEARKARRPRGAESGHRGHSNRNRGAKLASLTSKWGEGGVTGARGARTRVSWLCSPAGSETRRRPRGLEVRRRPLFRTVAVT